MSFKRLVQSTSVLVVLILLGSIYFNPHLLHPLPPMSYSTFQAELKRGNVRKVVITRDGAEVALYSTQQTFRAILPARWEEDRMEADLLTATGIQPGHDIQIEIRKGQSGKWVNRLGVALPMIVFFGIVFRMLRVSRRRDGGTRSSSNTNPDTYQADPRSDKEP